MNARMSPDAPIDARLAPTDPAAVPPRVQPGDVPAETYAETLEPGAAKLETKNLNFFYGKSQSLYEVTLPVQRHAVTAMMGPSGCGKSTLLRAINRIYALYPGQRAEGEVLLDGQNILGPPHRPGRVAVTGGHGVPAADAVPHVDLRQRRLRRASVREALQGRHGRPGGGLPAPRRPVGRGEGQAHHLRPRPLRRPAAAAVRGARRGREARGAAARRAGLGARPDLHQPSWRRRWSS